MPIPCNEWDFLKNKIGQLAAEPWFFQSAGSTFIGAALATAISVLTGSVAGASAPNALFIAWTVVAGSLFTGSVCLFFAHKERKIHKIKANEVVTHMNLIEQRFEREGVIFNGSNS
jgi:hypothetical protein